MLFKTCFLTSLLYKSQLKISSGSNIFLKTHSKSACIMWLMLGGGESWDPALKRMRLETLSCYLLSALKMKIPVSSRWQPPCCGSKIALSARELSVSKSSDRYILGIQEKARNGLRKEGLVEELSSLTSKGCLENIAPPRHHQEINRHFWKWEIILIENEARKMGNKSLFPPLALIGLWKAMIRQK